MVMPYVIGIKDWALLAFMVINDPS